ncbi:MAG: ABC transporter substrate-binding protein [Deltaproteobacteria bacterium]|nr:MAG: ABC transporter substrate-binding protein [Deltaproteobacteria bacterium]
MIRRLLVGRARLAALIAIALFWHAPAAHAEPSASARCIERLHATLLDVMKRADELGFEGRREVLTPTLTECFDLAYMGAKAAGRYWRELDEADRARMIRSFSRMTIATYASRFDGYDGETFEILGEQPSAQETVLVQTRLTPGSSEPVDLTYRMRSTPQGWRIIDVFLKGSVSELALRRSEYSSVIKRDGFDAFITTLDEKVSELENGQAQ